jgi:hypothetical protein
MEQKFKNLNRNIKALKRGAMPLSQTFEFDLFKESSWYFAFNEQELNKETSIHQSINNESQTPAKEASLLPEQKAPEMKESRAHFGKAVVFVGDNFLEDKESQREDLLGKMISAMKLTDQEFTRIAFDKNLEDIEDLSANLKTPHESTLKLWQDILDHKPQYLVSLGATLTNILLGKREKLSVIHGQFIEITITIDSNSHTCQLVPIFHPEFLLINPNMKRTAWIDLQKVMEKLGKI